MAIPSSINASDALNVYTDIRGLQGLKREKDQNVALQKIARQFESMFLQEMLKTMRKANEVFEEGSLFSGGNTQFYRDMYDQQLALTLSQKGTGLSDTLYQQLSQQYAKETKPKEGRENHLDLEDRRVSQVSPVQRPPKNASESTDALFNAVQAVFNGVSQETENESLDLVQSVFNAPMPAIEHKTANQFVNKDIDLPEYAVNFVKKILPHAKNAAQLLGVNPLLLTAQAALETGWGQYVIKGKDGQNTHNLFNIKSDKRWAGESASVTTLEYYKGVPVKERADFRSYGSFTESFQDYVNFLAKNPRYQETLASANSEHQYAHALQKAGYATDPQYANKVLAIFDQLNGHLGAFVESH
jgi:peptidoglycan hydrolase FlgJ